MKRRNALAAIPLSVGAVLSAAGQAAALDHIQKVSLEPRESHADQYMRKTIDMLTWIRNTQSQDLHEAAYAMARTIKNGGNCWFGWDMGHARYDVFPGRIGMPDICHRGFNEKQAKNNDLYIVQVFGGNPQVLIDKNIFVVGSPAPWSGDALGAELLLDEVQKMKVRPNADIWIENNITTLGAVVDVPGSPAPTGPVSGILGIVTYWMMIADACRILARDGHPVTVFGDEQALKGDSVRWVSLDDPLMDDYFDEIMRQFSMIELEMGYIRQVADMAVDTALNGGVVFTYSRDYGALCAEGDSRRGGLALTKGLSDRDGVLTGANMGGRDSSNLVTDKDLVIMGIFSPDDEVDLKHLAYFKKQGAKTVSIGPMTRNISVYPSYFPLYNETYTGRTVPGEVDIHIGRMCDTYGLFAIPGLERKVCPTSGALPLQLFWVTCMEIVDRFIARTGNTPGIYMSSALKKGKDHNHFMREQYAKRGY